MVKEWVDREYESGRVTILTNQELVTVISDSCKKLNIPLPEEKGLRRSKKLFRIRNFKEDMSVDATDQFSLRGKVFHTIRENILSGRYKYQEELRESTLGKELGVSPDPRCGRR